VSEEREPQEAAVPSLIDGGPLYHLMLRVGLVVPKPNRVVIRALLAVAVTFVPLLVLSFFQRDDTGQLAVHSLLRDPALLARFLVTLPLLILGELPVEERLGGVIRQFHASRLVPEAAEEEWRQALAKLKRRVSAVWAEAAALLLVGLMAWLGAGPAATHAAKWTMKVASEQALTPAGWWNDFFSRPLYQFIVLRWLWRLLVWALFLRQASRLKLQLIPTHPDGVAGLGFVGLGQGAFATVAFALSAGAAGLCANRVLYEHDTLTSLRAPMIGFVVVLLLLIMAPLFAFTPRLARLRWQGQFRYGALGARYARDFDDKWPELRQPAGEALLGTADIQSLADMQGSFEPVAKLRTVPIDFTTLRVLAFAAAIPFLPVLCIEIPLQELLKKVAGMVL
jgi:hypothetical protein